MMTVVVFGVRFVGWGEKEEEVVWLVVRKIIIFLHILLFVHTP